MDDNSGRSPKNTTCKKISNMDNFLARKSGSRKQMQNSSSIISGGNTNGNADWACVTKSQPKNSNVSNGAVTSSDVRPITITCWSTETNKTLNSTRQKSLGNIHANSTLNIDDALSSRKDCFDKFHCASCPSLTKNDSKLRGPIKQKATISHSYDERIHHSENYERRRQSDKLVVPDFFTTTKSRSVKSLNDASTEDCVQLIDEKKRRYPAMFRSAPESDEISRLNDQMPDIRRSSDSSYELSNSQTPTSCTDVSQFMGYLYLDTCRTPSNARSLCKLNIGSVVDVNAKHNNYSINEIPCMCNKSIDHRPAIMRLNALNTGSTDIQLHFEQINKFMEGARRLNKNVLVRSNGDSELGVVIILQYMITARNMDLRGAYSLVMKQRSDVKLNDRYTKILNDINKRTHQLNEKYAFGAAKTSTKTTDLQAFIPKEAWTHC